MNYRAMHEKLTVSVSLYQYMEKRVFCQLNGDRKVIGVLRGYDVRGRSYNSGFLLRLYRLWDIWRAMGWVLGRRVYIELKADTRGLIGLYEPRAGRIFRGESRW